MSYRNLLKFRESIEGNLPAEIARIVHHFFMPSTMSELICPKCRQANALAPMGIMGYIIENLVPNPPTHPRFRIYSTAECHTCNYSQTARFDLRVDDEEMLEFLNIVSPKTEAEAPPTQ